MKIAIRRGHQRSGKDGCANGLVNEIDVADAYYKLVMSMLRSLGHEVLDVTPPEANRTLSNSLYYGINKANDWGADLFVSCHANKAYNSYSGAIGCEVIYHKGSIRGKNYAKKIEKELANIGFKSRGAKEDVRELAEMESTKMPAVIIEPFFVEATKDVELYKKLGANAIAAAIVKGITGKSCGEEKTMDKNALIKELENLACNINQNTFGYLQGLDKLKENIIKDCEMQVKTIKGMQEYIKNS